MYTRIDILSLSLKPLVTSNTKLSNALLRLHKNVFQLLYLPVLFNCQQKWTPTPSYKPNKKRKYLHQIQVALQGTRVGATMPSRFSVHSADRRPKNVVYKVWGLDIEVVRHVLVLLASAFFNQFVFIINSSGSYTLLKHLSS